MFKNVYKKDRKGNLLDKDDNVISPDDPDKFQKAVHLADIHLEKGMHCADCHFQQDATAPAFSTTSRVPRSRSAVSIATARSRPRPTRITSGLAAMAPTNKNELNNARRQTSRSSAAI